MGFVAITRWRLTMEWDRLGGHRHSSSDDPIDWWFPPQDSRLQDKGAMEDGGRRDRLPRDGRDRPDHCDIPRRCSLRNFRRRLQSQWRAAGPGWISHYHTVSVARALALALSQGFTIATAFAGRLATPKARTFADSETTTGQKHLWCTAKPLGL
jgi:hypothetical protein